MTVDEKLNLLLDKVGGMESRMATKDDIRNMATKDDINNMATKSDLRGMVTKSILRVEMNMVLSQLDFVESCLSKRMDGIDNKILELREEVHFFKAS